MIWYGYHIITVMAVFYDQVAESKIAPYYEYETAITPQNLPFTLPGIRRYFRPIDLARFEMPINT